MSTVLVTGGLGNIGSYVTRKLIEKGEKVVTYDVRLDTTLVNDLIGKFECVIGDILELPSIIDVIKRYKVERIIHMVTAGLDPAEANPLLGFRIDVEGGMNVLEAARLMDIKRLVYISSRGVYGPTRGEHAHPTYKPIDEDYPKEPRDVYGAAKLFMENMSLIYNRIYGLDTVILRFAVTYGPGKRARHGVRALPNKIIESAMLMEPLKIPQGGDQVVDLVYNKDVANGILLACFAENLEHRVFHLGAGKGETLRHMIEILQKIFGEVPIQIGPGLNFFGGTTSSVRFSVFNIDRARTELGYKPQYDLEKGVRDYIETMRQLHLKPLASF